MLTRDSKGKYDYSNLNLICECGHSLGIHGGDCDTKIRPCFNHDCGDGKQCNCINFKKLKHGKAKEKAN